MIYLNIKESNIVFVVINYVKYESDFRKYVM